MNELFPKLKPEFNISDNKKYKVEAIKDIAVHIKEVVKYLPGPYYLIFQKSYLEKENI